MIIAGFLIRDSLEKIRFFKKTFLQANINIEIVQKLRFLKLQNTII